MNNKSKRRLKKLLRKTNELLDMAIESYACIADVERLVIELVQRLSTAAGDGYSIMLFLAAGLPIRCMRLEVRFPPPRQSAGFVIARNELVAGDALFLTLESILLEGVHSEDKQLQDGKLMDRAVEGLKAVIEQVEGRFPAYAGVQKSPPEDDIKKSDTYYAEEARAVSPESGEAIHERQGVVGHAGERNPMCS